MKKIILLVFGILSLVSLNGQKQTVDSAYFQAFYSLEYVQDLLKPQQIEKDEMIVLVGDSIASFYSYLNFKSDSLRKANPEDYKGSVVRDGDMQYAVPAKKKLPFSWNFGVFSLNRQTNEFSYRSIILPLLSKYGYSEQYVKPEWEIHRETDSILGHICQKATSEYGGRNWTVWFAPGIPISEGPWKLKGLPGLIMKAEADNRSFVFECIGFSRLQQKRAIMKDNKEYKILSDKDVKMLSKKDFVKIYVESFNDMTKVFLEAETMRGVQSFTSGNTVKPLIRKYNPLEIGGI
jgi:GLPGLI family protein